MRHRKTEETTQQDTHTLTEKMQFCGCLLISCLLAIILLCSVDGFRIRPAQHVDRPAFRSSASLRPRHGAMKSGEALTAKLLRLDDLVRTENDVMEPKRKRSFPGNSSPMDRLSVSSMETKQAANKQQQQQQQQSKSVELQRRRVNPPPIDRIGMSRLPNSRG